MLKSGNTAGVPECPVSPERLIELVAFERRAEIRFRNYEFLNLSFSHRSLGSDSGGPALNNERLEFLGDSVLGLIISDYLYQAYPERSEGELAKIKSYVVSEETLSEISLLLGVDKLLLVGKGEEQSGGRQKKAILADAVEALIGALYRDQGLEAARVFVLRHCMPQVEMVINNQHRKDYKTLLQEHAQKYLKTQPKYICISREGPDHQKIFTMEVLMGDQRYGPARGTNKKEAEQKAAAMAWNALFPTI